MRKWPVSFDPHFGVNMALLKIRCKFLFDTSRFTHFFEASRNTNKALLTFYGV
jgi:hypothetical protein